MSDGGKEVVASVPQRSQCSRVLANKEEKKDNTSEGRRMRLSGREDHPHLAPCTGSATGSLKEEETTAFAVESPRRGGRRGGCRISLL
jgi:hypothetical protein